MLQGERPEAPGLTPDRTTGGGGIAGKPVDEQRPPARIGQPYSQLMLRDLNHPSLVWTLTPPSGQIVQPTLDRTGSRIAYLQNGTGASTLVVARIVPTPHGPRLADRTILASGEIAQPAFTPDGHWISYLRAEGRGFVLDLEPASGGPSVKLAAPGTGIDAISRPVWTSS